MDNDLQSFVSNASQNWAAAGVPVTEDAAPVYGPAPVDTSPVDNTPAPESIPDAPPPAPAPNIRQAAPTTHAWDSSLNDTVPEGPAPVPGEAQGNQPEETPAPDDLSRATQLQQFPGAAQVGGLFSALGTGAQAVNQAARNIPGVAGVEDTLGSTVGQGAGAALGWYGENVADPTLGTLEYGLAQGGRQAMRNLTGNEQMFPDVPGPNITPDQNPWERFQSLGQWWRDAPYMDQVPEGARPAVAALATAADIANPVWDVGAPLRLTGLVNRGEAAVGRQVELARAAEDAGQVIPRSPLADLPVVGGAFERDAGAAEQAAREDAAWRAAQAERLSEESSGMGGDLQQAPAAPRFSPAGNELPTPDTNLDEPTFIRRGGQPYTPEAGNFPSMGRTPAETAQRLSELQGAADEATPRYTWQINPATGEPEARLRTLNDGQPLWQRTPEPAPGVGRGENFPAFQGGDTGSTLTVGDRSAIPAAASDINTAIAAAQKQLQVMSDSLAERTRLSRSAGESDLAHWQGAQQLASASNAAADRIASAADQLERQAQFLGVQLPPRLIENLHDTANTLRDAWQHPDPRVASNRLVMLAEERPALLQDIQTGVEAPRTRVGPSLTPEHPTTASGLSPEREARYRQLFGDDRNVQPRADSETLRAYPKREQVEAIHGQVTTNPKLVADANAFAKGHGLPDVNTMRNQAQAGTRGLIDSIDKGTLKPSETAGGTEVAKILKRAKAFADARDPNWHERPALGRPGHELVPADVAVSRLQRAAADVAAHDAGFKSAEMWSAARPATAASKIGRLYDQIQRVAIEHWLATPSFLKHVTASIGTLAGLHGINPMGANPARLARLMPQLRDLRMLNHGTAASLWGEQASHSASATRGIYQGLERHLGPAGKLLKPVEAAHAGYVEAIPALTHGYEARIKAAAFQQYFPQGVRAALKADPAALQTVARMAVPEAGVPGKVAREVGNFLHGAEGPESIKAIFDDARGRAPVSAKPALNAWEQRAVDTLRQADPETRARIADAQRLATKASQGRINEWMVNRANPTVLDQYAKKVFPFWHYDTQNPAIWARTAAENPLLASSTNAYLTRTNAANEAANRPDRLRGYFQMPNIGQGTGEFLNPLRGLGFQKFLYPHNYGAEQGNLGGMMGNLEMNGISPGLLPGMALTLAQRALGEHPEPRDLFPQSTWARYLAGTGLFNHPGFDAEAPLKNLLYGTSQDKHYDYEVQKELLAQMIRGEKPDLMAAHNEASKHMLTGSLFAMSKHEDPEEQQYLDLAKERRDLKASGGDVKGFDKAHPELAPWFSKQYGSTPDQFAEQLGAGRDWTAPDGTKIHFNPDGTKSVTKSDGTSYTTKPGAGTATPGAMSDKQYVASQFAAYNAIPETDKAARAKFLMDNAQSLRDHGFDKLDDDNTLQQRYWAAAAKQAAANGDHDALQHASAQLAQLKGEEPKRVYRTDAENAEYNRIWDQYRALTDSKAKAAFIAANKGRLTDLGYDFKDQTGQGNTSGSAGYQRSPYRGYTRGGYSHPTYGRGGYSAGQNSDRQAWASQWNAYNSLGDPKAKAQYLIDHYDEINGLAAKLGKEGVKSTPGQLQVSMRKGDNTLPEGAPSGSVQSQVAWLGQNQARIDSYNQLKDAAVAAQSGDEAAVNRLGALLEQHNNLFHEDLTGHTPEQIADHALLAQEDSNQLKRYWAANANGPHDAIGHVFDQYRALKDSGDRLGAARFLDSHWDELQTLGYKPTFPRPNVAALSGQQGGALPSGTATQGASVSNRYGSGTPSGSNASQEAGFWNQYFNLKNSGDTQGARTLLDANRDQVNAWRTAQGKAPLNPSFTRPAAATPNTGYAAAAPPTPWQPAQSRPQQAWQPARPRQQMLPPSPAIIPSPGRQAAAPARSASPWLPATGHGTAGAQRPATVPVSRPQPMHYLQPKPARGYNIPTERKSTGQRVSQ